MIANGWAGCTRELKYPVLLKIPICVPFGKQFSTLVQMCLTWDSPGNTRIKCFTQVDFQKFAVLSAAVEAGALERTSRFYREAIRSLVEATDTRGALTVASSKFNFHSKHNFQLDYQLDFQLNFSHSDGKLSKLCRSGVWFY
ncbi:hypothetical protein EDD11_004857 [Mortierella claussenii]|nr:hypothetical protein EDD11_004857 [Mortierella claussenii]